jgi:uncharacterized membrane protein YeaQ/YmgE (transglycosylase-associated protein family)
MGILWTILVGALAGWLAGQYMKGRGFGVLGNILVGVAGGVIGGLLFGLLGFRAMNILGRLVSATVGAVILLALIGTRKRT